MTVTPSGNRGGAVGHHRTDEDQRWGVHEALVRLEQLVDPLDPPERPDEQDERLAREALDTA